MRAHYDRWWAEIEPRVNEFSNLIIGSEAEPITLLSPADWQDVFFDQQMQVRRGLLRNGPWGLEVARDGTYAFELRRWPREADLPLTAGAPPFEGGDGSLPAGTPLPIAKAKLRVGSFEQMREAQVSDTFVRFVVPLKKGTVKAQTWFYDAQENELCGAYYTYVQLQRNMEE